MNHGITLIQIAEALHGDRIYKDNPVALTKIWRESSKDSMSARSYYFRNNLWYLVSQLVQSFLTLADDVKINSFPYACSVIHFIAESFVTCIDGKQIFLIICQFCQRSTQRRRALKLHETDKHIRSTM